MTNNTKGLICLIPTVILFAYIMYQIIVLAPVVIVIILGSVAWIVSISAALNFFGFCDED